MPDRYPTLYNRDGKVPQVVLDSVGEVRLTFTPPSTANYLLTDGKDSAELQRAAIRMNAVAVCLPAASTWLHQQVVKRPAVVLVWHSP